MSNFWPMARIGPVIAGAAMLLPLDGLALGSHASAQSPPAPPVLRAEDVLVTASIEPLAFDALARAIQTVSRRQLEQLGVDSVIDALRLLPGVDVRARGPLDVQTDFSIRGATFGQSLVLVDGFRLNDSQSGHHNGDIPMAVGGIDRVEVLTGTGSAVHGADALGGAINIISRRDPHATMAVSVGEHGLISGQASTSGGLLPSALTLTGWGSRSSGFTFDRDFAIGGAALRVRPSATWTLDARHQRKAFGADGFYGDSPSKEWTDQTLGAGSWRSTSDDWTMTVSGQVRNHGDHFRWDINRPGFAENRHRTNAVEVTGIAARSLGAGQFLTIGATGGGTWIASSNLDEHAYGRTAAFTEWSTPLGPRAVLQAGLRFDHYSSFGQSWSPSLSTGVWLSPELRLRTSVARAFRIPTFTELYYSDPNHLALADLEAERGWSLDGGADWVHEGWLVTTSAFRRWDEDVIDWVKANPADRWNTTNVRNVATTGIEVGVSRAWAGVLVRVSAASQTIDAPSLTLLSKYVLEYARHSFGGAVAVPLGDRLRVAVNLDHRRRVDRPAYSLVGARLSQAFGRHEIFVDAANLLDEGYYEVAGVSMPGRWVSVGAVIR